MFLPASLLGVVSPISLLQDANGDTGIAFALASVYLANFYFLIDYGVEKEMLFIPFS